MQSNLKPALPIKKYIDPIVNIVNDLEKCNSDLQINRRHCKHIRKTKDENISKKPRSQLIDQQKYEICAPNRSRYSSEMKMHPERQRRLVTKADVINYKERKSDTDIEKKCLRKQCISYDNLVKQRDEQIEHLKKKITTLHEYNDQFAKENNSLKNHIESISQTDVNTGLCKGCLKLSGDLDNFKEAVQKYQEENVQLTEDTNMMKTLVYRLNIQLERYQEKVRFLNREAGDGIGNDGIAKEVIKWGSVNNHTLAPLLNALTQQISEKSDIVQNYEDTLNNFTGQLKDVIAENENLQSQLEDVKLLQDQVKIWKSRSEILFKKNEIIKEKLSQVLKCYETKVQTIRLDYNTLYDQYNKLRTDFTNHMIVQDKDPNLHKECSEEIKKNQQVLTEVKSELDMEKSKLKIEIDNLKKIIIEGDVKTKLLSDENKELKYINENNKQLLEKYTNKIKNLQKRLDKALQWTELVQSNQESLKNSQNNAWKDMNEMEKLILQKESKHKFMQQCHAEEIRKLTKELNYKDKCLQELTDSFRAYKEKVNLRSRNQQKDTEKEQSKFNRDHVFKVRFDTEGKNCLNHHSKKGHVDKHKESSSDKRNAVSPNIERQLVQDPFTKSTFLGDTNIKRPDYFFYGDRVLKS